MDVALASVVLVGLFVMSYVSAWNHMASFMVASLVGAIGVAVFCDTALTPLFADSTADGVERFFEVGPSFILAASIAVGYVYAWKRKLFHVLVCVGLATVTICLGW